MCMKALADLYAKQVVFHYHNDSLKQLVDLNGCLLFEYRQPIDGLSSQAI